MHSKVLYHRQDIIYYYSDRLIESIKYPTTKNVIIIMLKYRTLIALAIFTFVGVNAVSAQTTAAYKQQTSSIGGLFDPAKFSMNQMVSFGMVASGSSSLKSQSLYTTMMQYKVAEPLTLRLNFSLPIHSTANAAQNLTPTNIESAEYFKNMPFDASLSWQPYNNLLMQVRVVRTVQTVADPLSPFINDYILNR